MSARRKPQKYRQPTSEEAAKINFIGYKLDEIFYQDEIEDFAAIARQRVIGEFFYAKERNPRYKAGSDRSQWQRTQNYILGVSGRVSELATYVQSNMRRPFITRKQLPSELSDLSPKLLDKLIQQLQRDVLVISLQVMRHHEVWYDEGRGIWEIRQSSVDEYLDQKRTVKAIFKVDDRNYHGRVRSQSKNRGVPPGVSVGMNS